MSVQSTGNGLSHLIAQHLTKASFSRIHTRFASGIGRAPKGIANRLVATATVLVAALAASGQLAAQAPTLTPGWTQASTPSVPPTRYIHAMSYDSAHSQVVLFGGYGMTGYLNDTWTWDGSTWTQAAPANSPGNRAAHAMAFDAAHNQVVLFGGLQTVSTRLGDTWLWDGSNWTQAAPATSPSPRDGAVMVYDAAHSQVLLFGGTNGSDLGDTWVWNGANWTQLNPANSPSPRADYSMVYDSVHGQVVLFGGMDLYGQYKNDTWIWNGSNWTQASSSVAPPARYAQGMAFDPAVGETVMWGGYNGSFLSDSWLWNGTNWAQISGGASPSGRYIPNGMVWDDAASSVLLFGGYSSQQLNDNWTWALPGQFPPTCVGACGGIQSQTFTYYLPASATFGTPRAVSQGTANLDFAIGSGNTCAGTVPGGSTCSLSVIFAPSAPGIRMGALKLYDSAGNTLVSSPLSGVGTAPAVAFHPGIQSVANIAGAALAAPKGITVDGAGNLYIADTGNARVLKVTPGPSASVVGSGLNYPQGLAVDGAGDVFIADNNRNQVVEVPAGCATAACQVVWASNLRSQLGVAVDGKGNLFAGDFLDGLVVKISLATGAQTTVYQQGGANPVGLATDSAGNLYIADFGRQAVVEVPAGCASAACQKTIGNGWSEPESVAVDAAGDVIVADAGLNSVVEVRTGCASTGCQFSLTSGITAFGAAVDSTGNVFLTDTNNGQILELALSQPPAISFADTNIGILSADSPLSVQAQNVGNTTLIGSLAIAGASFAQTPGLTGFPDCAATLSLLPGTECNLSLNFVPQGTGLQQGSATFLDNAGNVHPATQVVSIAGTGLASTFTLSVAAGGTGGGNITAVPGSLTCQASGGSVTGACAAAYPAGSNVTLTATPATGSGFQGWGGVCAAAGTNPTCTVTVSSVSLAVASFGQESFGSVHVCPSSLSNLACSVTQTVNLPVPADTVVGVIQVVTQGSEGLDFFQGAGSSCNSSSICNLNIVFAPQAPGLRRGAVRLFDINGNLIASTPIYGIGQESAIAFLPATASTLPTAGTPLAGPRGLTTDAAGDVFIADTMNSRVLKVAPDSTTTQIGFGLASPQGLAIDGAGNVFIADSLSNQVLEVPAGCTNVACQQIWATNLRSQQGVVLDGAGNLFVSDSQDGIVQQFSTTTGISTTVYQPAGASAPAGLALDSAGNLYIADSARHQVVEVPAGCQSLSCQVLIGSGWSLPESLSVDAAGDVFVADAGNSSIVEIPVGCNASACQLTVAAGISTFASTMDTLGNLYWADGASNLISHLNLSHPPALTFATTNVGTQSADSPQSVIVENIGNQMLTGAVALNLGSSFIEGATCDSLLPLSPGAECLLNLSFAPPATGYFTGSAVFTDNALNGVAGATHTISLTGIGGVNGQPGSIAVPDVRGLTQSAAASALSGTGLNAGSVSSAASNVVPVGSVIDENPAAGTSVAIGSAIKLLLSSGPQQAPVPNPLLLENNYFVTGDYATGGVNLRGTGVGGIATGTITIPNYAQSSHGVPDGADILAAYLYWETLENTPAPSGSAATFRGYSVTGQQIGNDQSYTDGTLTGTLRVYRADVNLYFPAGTNGVRFASGNHTVSLADSGAAALPVAEGASLVVIYRVLSPNFPLKSVVLYDGSGVPSAGTTQTIVGFYDAVGGAAGVGSLTSISYSPGSWNNTTAPVTLGQPNQYTTPLNAGNAYAALVLSTPVNNSDNDGLLDAWKAGPGANDFHSGDAGYYDVKTGSWVPLPGAKHGQKDVFVQLDYMCGAVLSDGSCDPTKENLFPSPDAGGRDPLALVTQAFATHGVHLHLEIGNAIPEDICTDNLSTTPAQLCQYPNQPGVVSWKDGIELAKLWPKNLLSCILGGDCTTRFPYGQKDSYHYALFGHSLAIPAWSSRGGTLTSIHVAGGITTLTTADRGNGLQACPSRITLSGVLGNAALNGVYNTSSCPDTRTILFATPGVPDWSYPNSTLPEPVIGLTSGTISSISGYSDLGGADSAITLGMWETAPNQDMSKRANVIAGTLFHELGHTLGLTHGGLFYDTAGSYVPTFDANCKPNYQSVMNYMFQLDLLGPNQTLDFSNQTLIPLSEATAGSVTQLADLGGNPATIPTTAWYAPWSSTATASAATRHCDGTPLNGGLSYRIDGPVSPITPAWTNGQDINFDGQQNAQMRGYNDWANVDLRQIGATGGEFATLASLLSFGTSATPLNVAAGGNVTLGSGGTITLGSGGNVTLGSGGNVTLGSGGTITLGSGGNVTLGSGGNVTLGSGGTITLGSGGNVVLGSGGNVTLGSGGTITLGSGGTITLGSGGNVTLGSGGTITLGSGGTVIIPSSGGSYTIDGSGGTVTLGSGGNVTLGSGGNVTLGSGGTITLGSGGNVTLGSGGNVTLGSGGTITLGSGGNVTLGSGGNVTLGSGGTITLGSGGTITLGSGGNVTLGSGGNVTLGSGGNVTLGSGGNVTLGSGGTATLGAGGTVTLGSGGNVTLGSGGNVTLGSGGTITLGSGGNITLGSGGTITLGSGGIITLSGGGVVTVPPGGSYTLPSGGGTITLGSGGNVTLGSGGNVTLGSGGTITLGSGGTITLGSGGTVTLGSGGNVTLGSGGVVVLGSGGNITLGSGGNVTLGSGGNVTLGSGGVNTDELSYETANSYVRPPTSPTEELLPGMVRVDWSAPAFGVVQTYSIYRSSNGATPILIGSVSGINGNPPATTFFDTNPDLTSKTVVYTITTTLVPDAGISNSRQSIPSPPAVLKNDQSIVLNPLPSSVVINAPQPVVSATAQTGGVPNGLQVNFTATGACSIANQSFAGNLSSATVALNNPGTCTITASQTGSATYNPATAVSGTFSILPQGSTLKSQTINFPSPGNLTYGGTFALNATSSSGAAVTFQASGPCTTAGATTGAGVCVITASAAGNATYSPATAAQSFTIYPAVLTVSAGNLSVPYGQPLPTLPYSLTGFVHGDPASAVNGTPTLQTTATPGSNAGTYPISVSTGSLAATNYSFLYVSGSLKILPLSQAITFTTNPPASAANGTSFAVAATGGGSGNAVTFTSAGACTNTGVNFTITSSSGTCQVIANQLGNTNYLAAPQVTLSVSSTGPSLVASASSIDFENVYVRTHVSQSLQITNTGTIAVSLGTPVIQRVPGGDSDDFRVSSNCRSTLAPHASCSVTVWYFADRDSRSSSAVLSISSNTSASPLRIPVVAHQINPKAVVNPNDLEFQIVKGNSNTNLSVRVKSVGTTPLIISSVSISGANAAAFAATNNCPASLSPGDSCTIGVRFTPPAHGSFHALLIVNDNVQDDDDPRGVSLSGNWR